MATINQGLMINARATSKKALQDIAASREKTGKEIAREGIKKETKKSQRRHAALTQKFLSEEGKGATVNFNA